MPEASYQASKCENSKEVEDDDSAKLLRSKQAINSIKFQNLENFLLEELFKLLYPTHPTWSSA